MAVLGGMFTERDYRLLGGVCCLTTSMTSIAFVVSWGGLFNLIEYFQQLPHSLGHCISHKFILVLPVSQGHSQDVTHQVHISNDL